MPPLPGPRLTHAGDVPERGHWYDADQMHAFAEQYRKAWVASLKPVAWMDEGLYEVLQEQGELRIGTIYTEKPNDSWLPLYRLDDQT
jgi:hypothetical protein